MGSLLRASATTFTLPGTCLILKEYGASFETQRCSQASSFGLVKMYVSGLLSVQMVNL